MPNDAIVLWRHEGTWTPGSSRPVGYRTLSHIHHGGPFLSAINYTSTKFTKSILAIFGKLLLEKVWLSERCTDTSHRRSIMLPLKGKKKKKSLLLILLCTYLTVEENQWQEREKIEYLKSPMTFSKVLWRASNIKEKEKWYYWKHWVLEVLWIRSSRFMGGKWFKWKCYELTFLYKVLD